MKKLKISKNMLLLIAILIATMIMGVGYASIEGITGEIGGKVIADAQEGVFITDVEYLSDIDASLPGCQIDNFLGTMLNSTIELSKTNPASEIKYKVTVYNSSTETVPFVGVVYDDDFYDNPDITFEITQEGFQIGQTIAPSETKEVYITFKYKNATTGIVPENTVLKSYLNFKMAEPNRMVVANEGDSTSNYLTSSMPKEKIESIKFEQGKEPEYSEKIISRFDASEKQDESIIGYYTDQDNNGLYEVIFVSREIIYTNKKADKLFKGLNNVTDIELENFSTLGTNSMVEMFQNCTKLKKVDVSKFDTSQVISMAGMFCNCNEITTLDVSDWNTCNVTSFLETFQNCKKLKNLDVSKWNTGKLVECGHVNWPHGGTFQGCSSLENLNVSNWNMANVEDVTNMFAGWMNLVQLDTSKWNTGKIISMSYMFYECKNLKEINVSKFDTSKVTQMKYMFSGCSEVTELDVSNFDTSQVTDMQYMFSGCSEVTELDVSKFNTSQVTDMQYVFSECSKVTELDVSNFNTNQVTNMQDMFNRM